MARTYRRRFSLKDLILIWLALSLVPMVYVVLLAVLLLIAATGIGLVVGAVYLLYINDFLFPTGFRSVRLMFVVWPALAGLSFFVLLALYGVGRAVVVSLLPQADFEPAIWLNPGKEPRLKQFVDDVCSVVGCRTPDALAIHIGPTFFVMHGKLSVLNANPTGRILVLSLPLCAVLSLYELRAILAHEFAHFTGNDVYYTKFAARVYLSTTHAARALRELWGYAEGIQALALVIPIWLSIFTLELFRFMFRLIDLALSRVREYRADAIAAAHMGSAAVAGGLKKVHAYAGIFQDTMVPIVAKIQSEPGLEVSPYRVFRKNLANFRRPARLLLDHALAQQQSLHDTHPNLFNRLRALEKISQPVPPLPNGDASALTLFTKLQEYEKLAGEFVTNEVNLAARQLPEGVG